jgi:hypothetical protein
MLNYQRVSKSQAGVAVRVEMVKPLSRTASPDSKGSKGRAKTPKKKVATICQWIGLRENLQETIDFPIKYEAFL